MRELICITCPKGCHLKVDEENDYKVTGNGCPRGAIYGKKECTHPTRVVTSTVKIVGAEIERLSVKTNGDIPKEKIFDVMKELNRVVVKAPVHREEHLSKRKEQFYFCSFFFFILSESKKNIVNVARERSTFSSLKINTSYTPVVLPLEISWAIPINLPPRPGLI